MVPQEMLQSRRPGAARSRRPSPTPADCRRLTNSRTSVRPMASRLRTAWLSRKTRRAVPDRQSAAGYRAARGPGAGDSAPVMVWNEDATEVQEQRQREHQKARPAVSPPATGSTVQPSTSQTTSAGGTRLRRRLSRIFQRSSQRQRVFVESRRAGGVSPRIGPAESGG